LFIFHFIYGIIIPTDELIFFRGVGIPPTRIKIAETSLGNSTESRHQRIPE